MAAAGHGLYVSRRRFVQGAGVAGLGLLVGCAVPSAPSPTPTLHRIAHLSANPPSAANDARVAAFQQGMHDLGYAEGQDLLIEQRYYSSVDQIADPAAELVRLQPDVILVPGATIARGVVAATTTIPIVSAGAGSRDALVASGLAASHAQPGGTVTGLSSPELVGKQLQLLQEAVPSLSRVAVLFNQVNPDFRRETYEATASS